MYTLVPPHLKNYARICWYEGIFSKEECEKISELGRQRELVQGAIAGEGGHVDHRVRDSKISWLEWTPETNWIFQKLGHVIQDANLHRYGMNLSGFTEALQYTEYGPGQHYSWHQDAQNGPTSIRKLSIVVLVADPSEYEGGDLKLFNLKEEIPRSQGTVLVFPSYEQHMVRRVTSGLRRSLVAWVSGPPLC